MQNTVPPTKGRINMKKSIIMILAAASALMILSSCTATPAATTASTTAASTTKAGETTAAAETTTGKVEYIKITPAEAKELIDTQEVIILDVRTQEEYDGGHIKDAVLLDSGDISAKAESVLPDKDATILVYCRSGNRSATASKQLIEMGYTKVMDFGGIIDWPYEVVS